MRVKVTGSQVIDHARRLKMDLSITAYCVGLYLAKLQEKKLSDNTENAYKLLGATVEEYEELKATAYKELEEKLYVTWQYKAYVLTMNWKMFFKMDSNNSAYFLQPMAYGNKKISWGRHPKQEVLRKFNERAKQYSITDLIKSKCAYFAMLFVEDWRQAMSAYRFLGKSEFFKEYLDIELNPKEKEIYRNLVNQYKDVIAIDQADIEIELPPEPKLEQENVNSDLVSPPPIPSNLKVKEAENFDENFG